jgi:hypothetical protein
MRLHSSNATSDAETISSRRLTNSESWTPEILSLALAILSVVAVIAMLAHLNGRSLPLWPSTFVTLNAVVAVLVTMTAAFVGMPLSNGLSQIKWIRVRSLGGAPLADMDLFNSASRGPNGLLRHAGERSRRVSSPRLSLPDRPGSRISSATSRCRPRSVYAPLLAPRQCRGLPTAGRALFPSAGVSLPFPCLRLSRRGYSYCLRGGKTGLFGAVGGWVFTVEEVYQMEEESRGGYKAE